MDQDFEIKGGRLIKYTGPGGDVAVPEGVTDISEDAFQAGPRGNELITVFTFRRALYGLPRARSGAAAV